MAETAPAPETKTLGVDINVQTAEDATTGERDTKVTLTNIINDPDEAVVFFHRVIEELDPKNGFRYFPNGILGRTSEMPDDTGIVALAAAHAKTPEGSSPLQWPYTPKIPAAGSKPESIKAEHGLRSLLEKELGMAAAIAFLKVSSNAKETGDIPLALLDGLTYRALAAAARPSFRNVYRNLTWDATPQTNILAGIVTIGGDVYAAGSFVSQHMLRETKAEVVRARYEYDYAHHRWNDDYHNSLGHIPDRKSSELEGFVELVAMRAGTIALIGETKQTETISQN